MNRAEAGDMVIKLGRAYKNKDGKRITLHVFSKQAVKLDQVCRLLGGNYYRHGSGFLWIMGNKSQLVKVYQLVRPSLIDINTPHKLQTLLEYGAKHETTQYPKPSTLAHTSYYPM